MIPCPDRQLKNCGPLSGYEIGQRDRSTVREIQSIVMRVRIVRIDLAKHRGAMPNVLTPACLSNFDVFLERYFSPRQQAYCHIGFFSGGKSSGYGP